LQYCTIVWIGDGQGGELATKFVSIMSPMSVGGCLEGWVLVGIVPMAKKTIMVGSFIAKFL